jgi:hypothetical protein
MGFNLKVESIRGVSSDAKVGSKSELLTSFSSNRRESLLESLHMWMINDFRL